MALLASSGTAMGVMPQPFSHHVLTRRSDSAKDISSSVL